MSDSQDKIYELRFYKVAPGRDGDMRRRVQNDLAWLFPRHGIRPIASWSAIAGHTLPMFIYLTPWPSMEARNRHWGGFYSDPDWQEVRNRTNAGSELVEDYEIYFLREARPFQVPAGGASGIDEVMLQQTLVGKSLAVADAMNGYEREALSRAGGDLFGAFDVLSGGKMPALFNVIHWPEPADRLALERTLSADGQLQDARRGDAETYGAPLLGHRSSFLAERVDVDWQ